MKFFCTQVLATVCCVVLLAACKDDDSVEPAPSTVDTSEWPLNGDMDTLSYRAGDDFYMYCNGNYWKTTDLGDELIKSFFDDAADEIERLVKQTDMPHKTQLEALAKAVEDNPMTEDEISEYMDPLLELIDEASTYEDCIKLLARFYKMGYDGMLCVDSKVVDGVYKPTLSPAFYYSETDESAVVKKVFVKLLPIRKQLDEHPELMEKYHPLANTRIDGNDVATLLVTELGLNPQDVQVSDEDLACFATYLAPSLDELKEYLTSMLWASDMPFMDPSMLAVSNEYLLNSPGSTFNDWIDDIINTCYYTTSYHFVNKWVTPQMVEEMEGKCEELRSVFRRRIADLDWMSGSTKEKAIRKLDMMTFNVGYPKNWVQEALVDFSQCQTMVEAVRMARKADVNLLFSYLGKDIKTCSFNDVLYSLKIDLAVVNSFSTNWSNAMFILPAFLMPPLYDLDAHEAIKYATLYVVGHEVVHCFDEAGALYDELGNYRNWWTVQDKMDFEERYQTLIDCYNRLEMLPWDPDFAGVYCPGEQTLGENIADLGGFEIAHQAYIEKCQREGYYGEELDKQERKLYQAFAHFWCAKYNSTYVVQSMFEYKDAHPRVRERINGVVMNTDRWYELYNVQWGDNLYLRPERRTHIW